MLPQVQIELGIGRTRTGMFLATFYLNEEEELNGESGGGWVGTGCTYVCWERTEQAEQRKSSGRRPLSPHMQQTAPGCGGPPLAPSPAAGDALPLPMDIDDGSGAVPPRGDLR